MDNETALAETAVPEEAQTALAPDSTEETKPEATAEAAAEVTPSADQATEPPPASKEPPPPFATIDGNTYGDAYETYDSPALKDVRDRDTRDIQDTATRQGRQEAERDFNRSQAGEVTRGVAGQIGTLLERLESGNAEGADRIVDRINEMMSPYTKIHISTQREEATQEAYREASGMFRQVLMTGLPRKAQHELIDFMRNQSSWEAVLSKRQELLVPGIEARLEKGIADRRTKEATAREREGTKPPAEPKGGSGGGGRRTEAEEQLDPSTSIKRLEEIQAR